MYFFDRYFERGLPWYKAHFPSLSQVKRSKAQLVSGEASTTYIYHPLSPARIREAFPNVKLLALLRDPVDRAYSHYQHEIRANRESASFEEALESQNMEQDKDFVVSRYGVWDPVLSDKAYLARSIYVDYLRPWFDLFPPEQIRVIQSEQMFTNPAETMREIFTFLQLPEQNSANYPIANHGGKYATISAETRSRLTAYFQPHNRELYDLIGREFDWD